MHSLSELLLRPLGIRRWLVSSNLDRVVGSAHDESDCPLAVYLSDLYGTPVLVDENGYLVVSHGHLVPLTSWQRRLVSAIDAQDRHRVTASEVLKLLDDEETR